MAAGAGARIQVGDTVTGRVCPGEMTVEWIDGLTVGCFWIGHDNKRHEADFHVDSLIFVSRAARFQ
jgi:hypothetical protein